MKDVFSETIPGRWTNALCRNLLTEVIGDTLKRIPKLKPGYWQFLLGGGARSTAFMVPPSDSIYTLTRADLPIHNGPDLVLGDKTSKVSNLVCQHTIWSEKPRRLRPGVLNYRDSSGRIPLTVLVSTEGQPAPANINPVWDDGHHFFVQEFAKDNYTDEQRCLLEQLTRFVKQLELLHPGHTGGRRLYRLGDPKGNEDNTRTVSVTLDGKHQKYITIPPLPDDIVKLFKNVDPGVEPVDPFAVTPTDNTNGVVPYEADVRLTPYNRACCVVAEQHMHTSGRVPLAAFMDAVEIVLPIAVGQWAKHQALSWSKCDGLAREVAAAAARRVGIYSTDCLLAMVPGQTIQLSE